MSSAVNNHSQELPIIDSLIESGLSESIITQIGKIQEKTKKALDTVEHYQGERNSVSKIGHYVKQRVRKIFKTNEKKHSKDKKEKIYLTLYLQWVLKKFTEAGLDISKSTKKHVPAGLRSEMHNILHHNALTSFFIVAKYLGVLDMSENLTSTWEEERELKLLATSRSDVAQGLIEWGKSDSSLKFTEGDEYLYTDEYQDTKYASFEFQKVRKNSKRTFRIRKKTRVVDGELDNDTTEYLYTIKREKDAIDLRRDDGNTTGDSSETQDKDIVARTCYEKEFKILKFSIFVKALRGIGFLRSRTKEKYRKSYDISFLFEGVQVQAKLDIDDYRKDKIPELLEVECSAFKPGNTKRENRELTDRAIEHIISQLDLTDKERLVGGSKKLFKRYNKKYNEHFTKDEHGNLIWYDPENPDEIIETSNINDAPELDKAA